MTDKQNLCTMCADTITNPVCEKCYLREIAQWLRDFGIGPIPMRIVFTRIKEEMSPETMNETTCIICGRETLSACAYCFFLKAAKVFKELNFPDRVIRSFLEVFNYRHWNDTYHL